MPTRWSGYFVSSRFSMSCLPCDSPLFTDDLVAEAEPRLALLDRDDVRLPDTDDRDAAPRDRDELLWLYIRVGRDVRGVIRCSLFA